MNWLTFLRITKKFNMKIINWASVYSNLKVAIKLSNPGNKISASPDRLHMEIGYSSFFIGILRQKSENLLKKFLLFVLSLLSCLLISSPKLWPRCLLLYLIWLKKYKTFILIHSFNLYQIQISKYFSFDNFLSL